MANISDEELIRRYEAELAMSNSYPTNSYAPYSSSMIGNSNKQNVIEYELDLKDELVEIERLLRNDLLKRDADGNEYFIRNPNPDHVPINEVGVNDILARLRGLVNKNKILSNYTPDEITIRVKMIQNEMRILLYNNYEMYGMDNEYKMNNYSSIILVIGSIMEDAYKRAMGGETHKGFSENRIINENRNVNPQGNQPVIINTGNQNRKSIFKPWTWLG